MIVLIVAILGVTSLLNLKLALMPELDIAIAIVTASYEGAGPEEVENMVTKPLESALGTVSNLSSITTSSSSGSALLVLTFEDGTNMDSAALKIRENIDLVKRFLPNGVDPYVLQIDPNMLESITIGITGTQDLVELKNTLDNSIINRLEKLEGVASVNTSGGREREISINLKPDRLSSYGLNPSQIATLLAAENRNLPGGIITQGDLQLQIRSTGEFTSIADIRNLNIGTIRGLNLTLADVADVVETYKKTSSYAIINGQMGISLSIMKQSIANTVDVSDNVNAELLNLQRDFPDLSFILVRDSARFVKTSINNVWSAVYQATLFAVIVLFVFTGETRSSIIIGMSIPISILATITIMYFLGMTLNMVTLISLVISVGMLVDNSIVVLENIMRHMEMGKDNLTASIEATKEIMISVMGSTLTTVIVFVPVLYTTGLAGEMFKQLGLVLGISLMSSLVVALTFVPMASSKLLRATDSISSANRSKLWQSWNKQLLKLDTGYAKLLAYSLNHKTSVIIITTVAVILTGSIISQMGMEMTPTMDMSTFTITITLPKGSLIEETGSIAENVMSRIEYHPAIDNVSLTVGSGSGVMSLLSGGATNEATLIVNLLPKEEREPILAVADEIRNSIGSIAGADITVSANSMGGGAGVLGGSNSIDLMLFGDDMEVLEETADRISELISVIPYLSNIKSSISEGSPQANVKIDRQKASFYNLQPANIAATVQMAINGTLVTRYKDDGNEIDVMLRYNPDDTDNLQDLENMIFTTPTGARVALHEIATISLEKGPSSITKENSKRYVSVTADIEGTDLGSVTGIVDALLVDFPFEAGYYYEHGGTYTMMMESFETLIYALLLGFVLVYMVIASQFESLIYPFIIIFSVPIAMTAGLFGLFITGQTISVLAIIGLILLVGVVVNNGIVLVDFIHILREEGNSTRDAILGACPVRLRPILMTTITTVVGLIPTLFATGEGSEIQTPLGAIVASGLSASTLVTLVLIPVLYEIVYDFRNRKTKIKTEIATNE